MSPCLFSRGWGAKGASAPTRGSQTCRTRDGHFGARDAPGPSVRASLHRNPRKSDLLGLEGDARAAGDLKLAVNRFRFRFPFPRCPGDSVWKGGAQLGQSLCAFELAARDGPRASGLSLHSGRFQGRASASPAPSQARSPTLLSRSPTLLSRQRVPPGLITHRAQSTRKRYPPAHGTQPPGRVALAPGTQEI